jgi:hypothetical protein
LYLLLEPLLEAVAALVAVLVCMDGHELGEIRGLRLLKQEEF